MTKNLALLTTIFLSGFCLNSVHAETLDEDKATLNLTVKNIHHDRGMIYIAIFDRKDSFMKERYAEEVVEVRSKEDLNIKLDLPFGKYAVSIFHDVNGNKKLNTNLIGIPKEPYGFSNNPKINFGPPDFDRSAFSFGTDGHRVEISLK